MNDNFTTPEIKPKEESFFKEIVKFTLIALAIVIPVRAYIAQPFVVSGASMDPTFESGEYLIVDELSFRFNEPARGQVIIFRFPKNEKIFFIKRIIGLPGETIKIQGGKVTVINNENPEGFTLDEAYIDEGHKIKDYFMTTLGPDEYFVMGDNRAQSSDSRAWGPLVRENIIGRPFVRLLPVNKIRLFPGKVEIVEEKVEEKAEQ
jgi:signal peptidase I